MGEPLANTTRIQTDRKRKRSDGSLDNSDGERGGGSDKGDGNGSDRGSARENK